MSAIKLPVSVRERGFGWALIDAEGIPIANWLSEPQAKQIALALNLHDDLISELTRIRDVVGDSDFELIGKLLERATL